ncbi:hypothetical protein ACTFIY_007370 [Dictyostelium cf. discoideum]
MSKNCGNCGNDSFASSNEGSVVCTACGTVKESANIVSEVQFGGDSSIVGTFVSATRKPSSYRSLGGRDSRAMSVENARKKLDQIGNSLRIRSHLIDSAQRTFELAMENNFTKGRQTRLVAAACLYIVCRRERTPHLLIDFSENLQVNVFVVAGTFLQLIKLLNIQLPIVDPSFFIQRFASALEFGDQTKDVIATANKLVARMKRDWMSIGRKPSGICGASLYIASKIHGFKRSMKEIVHVVKIGEQTLINRLDEFRKTPTATLRFDEFNGMDLEDQCDPPSFTRARLKEKREEEKLKLLEEKKEKKERKRLKKEKKKLLELENNKDNKEIIIKENKGEIEKKQDLKKEKKDKIKGSKEEEKDDDDDEEEEDEEEEDEDNLNDETKGDNKKNKKRKRELLKETIIGPIKDDDDIEKESNDIVKGSQNVQSIKDITNVDSIPTTLLENIEKFEKIQSDIKTLAQKVKNEMEEKIKESQSQEPETTPPPPSTTNTQTTTQTTTQTITQTTTPISQNNVSSESMDPLPVPINKTMDSVVSYPTITSTIDQSVFAPNDDLENLSDEELDFYLEHDEDTVKKKEEIWVELNKEWIEKNEERQREIEEDIKAGRPPRKRKAPVSKKSAENAQAAAEEELKKRTRNAKLVEKLGLFKPNFVTMGLFGGAGASNNQAAVGAMLSADGTISKNTSTNPKETNKEDDDDDDYEPIQPVQSGSLLSRNFNNYEEEDY